MITGSASGVLKDLILWYYMYFGKDVPNEKLPALEMVREWYLLLEQEGKTRTNTHRPSNVAGSSCARGAVDLLGSPVMANSSGSSGVRVADPSRAAGSSGVPGSSGGAGLSPSGDAAVDAVGDAGYYARYGETAPPPRGAHAGVDLGHRRVSGV